MFAPLRGVMAMQSTHCDMAAGAVDGNPVVPNLVAPNSNTISFDKSLLHDMSTMSSIYSSHQTDQYTNDQDHPAIDKQAAVPYQTEANHQCCCCDSHCVSDCEMGMSATMLIQNSSYAPQFVNVAKSLTLSSDLVIRALTPPSRPPLVSHN
jgi:hypothetical protein